MGPEKKITTELVSKNTDPISFFNNDADFIFVFKKTEKLASAVYMVSNLFSDSEPMKWNLRKKVSDLLSLMVTYDNVTDTTQRDFNHTTSSKVVEIISLLEISHMGGLVSQMNFNVLKQEFSSLLSVLSETKSLPMDSLQNGVNRAFFDTPQTSFSTPNQTRNSGFDGHQTRQDHGVSTNQISGQLIGQTHSSNEATSKNAQPKDDLKRSNRQSAILSLIKRKKEVSINDLTLVIKDCSEKTVQRELNHFISTGLLKRTGVRRWSKYSMN